MAALPSSLPAALLRAALAILLLPVSLAAQTGTLTGRVTAAGETMPRWGCRQRSSASQPVTLLSPRLTSGW